MNLRESPPQELTGQKPSFTVLAPQSVLNQRYRVENFMAAGGMSLVYRAQSPQGPCLLKEVSSSAPRAVISLTQEKTTLERLDHARIPKVYDLFEQEGYYYLVMQLIQGQTLEHVLPRPGSFLQEQVVRDWALQLCDIFEYLHSRQPPVIYRDLKPGNLIKDREGHIYLVDFGLARTLKTDKSRDTELLGSVITASPEHYGVGQTDVRSDIYTIGATIHYLLTSGTALGDEPFTFLPIRQVNPRVSENLEQIIIKATQRQPEHRYPTVATFRQALLNSREQPLPVLEPYGSGALSPKPAPSAGPTLPSPSGGRLVIPTWVAMAAGGWMLLTSGFFLARLTAPRPASPPAQVQTGESSPTPNLAGAGPSNATSSPQAPNSSSPAPDGPGQLNPGPGLPSPPTPSAVPATPQPMTPPPVALPQPGASPPVTPSLPPQLTGRTYPVAAPHNPEPQYPVARRNPTDTSTAPSGADFPLQLPDLQTSLAPAGPPTGASFQVSPPSDYAQVESGAPQQWIYLDQQRRGRFLGVRQFSPAPVPMGQPEAGEAWLQAQFQSAGAQNLVVKRGMVNGRFTIQVTYQLHQAGLTLTGMSAVARSLNSFFVLSALAPVGQDSRMQKDFEEFVGGFRLQRSR